MLNRITKLAYLLAFLGIIAIGADYSHAATTSAATLSLGDDDDKKRGKGRGRDKQKGDRDDRHKQRDSDHEARRQQRDSDNESRRQQHRSDQNARRQQHDSDRESRRQQQMSDWNSRRQQNDSDRESRRQQQWSDRNSRRHDRDDDSRRGRWNRDRSDERRVYVSPQGYWNPIWNVQRKDQRRYEKEQRKYLKEQQKAERKSQRHYARDQRRFYGQNIYSQHPVYYGYDDNVYDHNDYDSGGGSDWKDLILRNVIANVLGGGGLDAGDLLNQTRYVQNVPNYAYYDDRYTYQRRPMPYYAPSQVDYGYYEPGYDSPANGLLNSLPIAEIIQQFTGDNEFVSMLVGGFLSQGYDQGYLAGQTAREYDHDEYYNDPYAYSNGSSDLHSAALAENRQYLSQGYELGYQDALNGNAGYDPYAEGNVDLVSALLNNVLSGI